MPLIPTLLSVCELCSLPSLFPSLHSLGSLWLLQLPQWSPRDLCPWPRFSAAARAPLAPHTPHSPRYVGMHVHTGLLPAFALHWFLTLAFTGVHCFLLSSLLGSPVSSSPYSSLRGLPSSPFRCSLRHHCFSVVTVQDLRPASRAGGPPLGAPGCPAFPALQAQTPQLSGASLTPSAHVLLSPSQKLLLPRPPVCSRAVRPSRPAKQQEGKGLDHLVHLYVPHGQCTS